MFCINFLYAKCKSRDNLERLLVARLVRNNETLIRGRTFRVNNLKCGIKNWITLEDVQQAVGTYHEHLL